MQISSETQRYYDRNISIIPTADYIVVPGAKVELTTPGLNSTNTYATLKRVKDFVGDKSVLNCTLFTPSPASLETNSFYIYTEKEENFN